MASTITAGNATNGLGISSDNTGILALKSGTGAGTTALTLDASQNATFAGAVNGSNVLVPNAKLFRLNSALAGANVTTAQNVLGVGVTLATSTVYAFEAVYAFSKSAGVTAHSLGVSFGGTATLNNIAYASDAEAGVSFAAMNDTFSAYVQTAGNATVTGTVSTAAYFSMVVIRGTVSVNAGGTFIPQYNLSVAPGGAYTTASGSYFSIYPIGAAGSNTNVGGWA